MYICHITESVITTVLKPLIYLWIKYVNKLLGYTLLRYALTSIIPSTARHAEIFVVHARNKNFLRVIIINRYSICLGVAGTGPTTTTTTTIGPPLEAEILVMDEVLTNYSVENFPSRDLSTPIDTTVDIYLVGINDLDEVLEHISCQFWVTMEHAFW